MCTLFYIIVIDLHYAYPKIINRQFVFDMGMLLILYRLEVLYNYWFFFRNTSNFIFRLHLSLCTVYFENTSAWILNGFKLTTRLCVSTAKDSCYAVAVGKCHFLLKIFQSVKSLIRLCLFEQWYNNFGATSCNSEINLQLLLLLQHVMFSWV